jgi:hypothetical protein
MIFEIFWIFFILKKWGSGRARSSPAIWDGPKLARIEAEVN